MGDRRIVLGVDGGGTQTRAAILTEDGEVLGMGTAGPSNYDDIGIDEAQLSVRKAVEEAYRAAGLHAEANKPLFDGAYLGMAGVVSVQDHAAIHGMAERLRLGEYIGVDHDIRIALAGGLSGRPGIALITGTGSSCYGINAEGKHWRSGGWGGLLADEGGGYWLGVEAMRAATRAYDGRGRETSLLEAVTGLLRLNDLNEIMHRVYVQGMSRAEIAALAPLVIEAAQQGDGVAFELVERAARELADCVIAVAHHLHMDDSPCDAALVGGMFAAGDILINPLRTELQYRLPQCILKQPELSPVLGACLLALQMLGIWLRQDQLDRLRQSQQA